MNPFSRAIMDYHEGDDSAAFVITRNDGYHQQVPASVFFADSELPPLEGRALEACRGRVLDVGAAVGRHSLQLIRSGLDVVSLDILPEMEAVLRDRGATHVIISDVFEFTGDQFDTLLMLMNGIGMVGTLDELDRFLKHAHEITSQSGQIICDSVDVSVTANPVHSEYRQQNIVLGREPGQQTFTITYNDLTGESFDWLHIDYTTLSSHATQAGWQADLIVSESDGHYLCRLTKKQANKTLHTNP